MKRAARREFLKLAGVGMAATGLSSLRSGAARAGQTGGFDVRGGALDLRIFGAAGDGKKLDTVAVNKVIAAAAFNGGSVHFPPETYLCHSIHLKSKVSIFLAQGATILAADSPKNPGNGPAYDLAEPNQWDQYQDFGHSHWHNSLLWGEGISDIEISLKLLRTQTCKESRGKTKGHRIQRANFFWGIGLTNSKVFACTGIGGADSRREGGATKTERVDCLAGCCRLPSTRQSVRISAITSSSTERKSLDRRADDPKHFSPCRRAGNHQQPCSTA